MTQTDAGINLTDHIIPFFLEPLIVSSYPYLIYEDKTEKSTYNI